MKTITKFSLASLGAAALGTLIYLTRATPDDMIRYLGQDNLGNSTVAVMNYDLVTNLRFDLKGQLIEKLPVRRTSGAEFCEPQLQDLVARLDFPLGVEFAAMLNIARDYQRTNHYEKMLLDQHWNR